ncbi:MAG: hypothetical protein AB7O62_15535 [Pirellulales bacterium]
MSNGSIGRPADFNIFDSTRSRGCVASLSGVSVLFVGGFLAGRALVGRFSGGFHR